MFHAKGGCHCANICVDLGLSHPLESYNPRACDCDFCRKQSASYISDPNGKLILFVKDARLLGKYRQGSDTADFLFCRSCGVLVGATYQAGEQTFATINSRVIDENNRFGAETVVSPKTLSASDKTKRWKEVWFSNVTLTEGAE